MNIVTISCQYELFNKGASPPDHHVYYYFILRYHKAKAKESSIKYLLEEAKRSYVSNCCRRWND